eukprot:GFUD01007199.1.p1 GENE.GFUD01007199.1~~GFUD01007199.1.p1  ORF type:complete len:335 (-),score=86.66 GFUD01007199.1:250-1203(-)
MAKLCSQFVTSAGGHSVYFEAEHEGEIPVLVFHGGWGPLEHDGAFLDPQRYRKVYIHQRGWGKSIPAGGVENNDVESVLKDCEDVRKVLNIDKWIVVGGSTGAMLAFAYGSEYPGSCLGVLLRGLWLLSPSDLDFNYQDPKGKAYFYPQEWEQFLASSFSPPKPDNPDCQDTSQVVSRYGLLVSDKDRSVAAAAAQAWLRWDCLGSSVLKTDGPAVSDDVAILTAKIGLHLYREALRRGDYLFARGTRNMAEKGTVVRLVTGRHDMLCPPAWAHKVARQIRQLGGDASCTIVEGAAHSELDPGMMDAMKSAITDLKE